MLGNIVSVSVSVTAVTANHSFCGVSDTAETQNAVSAAVSVTPVTKNCGFSWSLAFSLSMWRFPLENC